MQQIMSEREISLSRNREVKVIFCQQCLTNIQRQICICSNCLSVMCGCCSQKHQCIYQNNCDTQRGSRRAEKSPPIMTQRKGNQHSTSQIYPELRPETVNQKSMLSNCERCRLKTAVKRCFHCCIQYFCLNCFKLIHASEKLQRHEAVDLNPVETQQKKCIITSIISQYQNKRGQNVKLSELNINKINLPREEEQGEAKEQTRRFIRSKVEQIQKNSTFLTSFKLIVQEESKNIKKRNEEFKANLRKQLESIIEETNLKIMEFDLKIADKTKSSLEECNLIMKDLEKTDIVFSQLAMIIENRPAVSSAWKQKITSKLNRYSEEMVQISQKHKQIEDKNDAQHLSENFYDEATSIKEKIGKIDLKRAIVLQSTTKSSIVVNLKSPKKSEGKKKSEMNSCKNSNISSCKSIDKLGSYSVLLNSPQTKKYSGRSSKNLNNDLNSQTVSSIIIDHQEESSKREEHDNLYSTYSIARNYNPEVKKSGRNLHEVKSKGTLQKVAINSKSPSLKSSMSSYSNFNSGVNKALANIQNTKKQLKDIRAQMNDYSSRISTDKNFRSVAEINDNFQDEEQLDISHISIESLVFNDKK